MLRTESGQYRTLFYNLAEDNMKCPNCGLINPETAEKCDCGFDFVVAKQSRIPIPEYKKSKKPIIYGLFYLVLGVSALFFPEGDPTNFTPLGAIIFFIFVVLALFSFAKVLF